MYVDLDESNLESTNNPYSFFIKFDLIISDICFMTSLRELKKLEKIHNEKIRSYNAKLKMYKKLIQDEIDDFEPIKKKIQKKQHRLYIKDLIDECKESYQIMADSNDMKYFHKSGVQITPIKVYVAFQGSHLPDDNSQLVEDSLTIDRSTYNVKCDLLDEIDIIECLSTIDDEKLMDMLEYVPESLRNGTWSGTIKMYIVGKYDRIKK